VSSSDSSKRARYNSGQDKKKTSEQAQHTVGSSMAG